jgi:hypothetical protein
MNWKLVLQLSLFGLAMAIATVFVIPSSIEPFVWLAIFVFCAYLIAARRVPRPFLHGLAVGVVNSIWVTSAHVLLFNQYIANHAREAEMMRSSPLADSPRLMMAITGPIIGVISGIVLGLFALVAVRLVAPRAPAAGAT